MQSVDMIKVSVITYVKNTETYIEECIRSIMHQTLREIEILVVDGGSIDGTLEIISELRKEDERIRLLNAPASVGAQFNLGLSQAKGEYIAICEADDHILPEMLEKEYMVAHENRLDVLRADYYQFCNVFGKECRFYTKTCFVENGINRVLDGSKDGLFLKQGIKGFWNGIYRREFLIDNDICMNETAGASYQDITFSFLTQMIAKRIYFMDEAFYCYRIDNPNASMNSQDCIKAHIQEYGYLAERLRKRGVWEKYKNMYYSWELVSYDHLMNQLSGDAQKNGIKDIYKDLKVQDEKEQYEINDVLVDFQELAMSLMAGEQYFIKAMLDKSPYHVRMLEYFGKEFMHDDDIVVFGMGHMGRIVKRFLDLSKKRIYLADNNDKLHGESLEDGYVYAPDEIVKIRPLNTYIIANQHNAQDMVDQLARLGVKKDNIVVCCDEDLFLRKVFAGSGGK